MAKKLRFTGEFPPVKLRIRFPNWEYALDEEGEEGQDETTLRPAANQKCIDEYTAFTTGTATFADGRSLPVFLCVYHGPVSCEGVDVFINASDSWKLTRDYRTRCWSPFEQAWLPPEERQPVVSMEDPAIFPLEIRSTLPLQSSGKPFLFSILPDGETRGSPSYAN